MTPVPPRPQPVTLGEPGLAFIRESMAAAGEIGNRILQRRRIVDVVTDMDANLPVSTLLSFSTTRPTTWAGRDLFYAELRDHLGDRPGTIFAQELWTTATRHANNDPHRWTEVDYGVLIATPWPCAFDELETAVNEPACFYPIFYVCDKDLTALGWASHGTHADRALITRIVDSTVLVAQMAYDGDGFVIASLD